MVKTPIKSLTACICTHNRAGLLPRLLDTLERLPVPEGLSFEALIVDNGSTDGTAEVCGRYVSASPSRFRYVYEGNLGLSNARNRGIRESGSDVIAFLDDDAVPRPGWLEALLEGYAQGDDIAVVGGQVLLALPGTNVPGWFKKPLYHYYSEKEMSGERIMECKRYNEYPFGANISFRREVAAGFGGFDSGLGRIGAQMLSGEETQLCRKIEKAGYRILMNPRSIVDHYIPLDRIRLRSLFRQAWADGKVYFVWQDEAYSADGVKQGAPLNFLKRLLHRAAGLVSGPPTISGIIQRSYGLVAAFSMRFHRMKTRTGGG